MQREAAAGDDIRQTAVLLQKLIKIQIVVAYDELDVHIRQLGLNIGGIGLVQAGAPQIHLNGLGIFLLLYLFCVFCAAAGQQGKPHRQCCQHRNQAAQCSFVHQIVLLTTLGQPPFCGKAAVAYRSYIAARRSVRGKTRPRKCVRPVLRSRILQKVLEKA